ncbi:MULTISPECIES: element excision factor XisH family protein [unclassified Okeania]|uniref:element excision factor XisH family protein n=1 Tax=unclassified Okeania TaxID=2634635 RepID=UPI002580A35B|nr:MULTISPECIES: element excision factor XisH family protein [unclassified Okeania]
MTYQKLNTQTTLDFYFFLLPSSFCYKRFFKYPFIQTVIHCNQIPLIIYDVDKEAIAQWIN